MDRLVTQMLELSRLESSAAVPRSEELSWPTLVEQVISDCLPLAERRRIELACDWPAPGVHALPLLGNAQLMMVLLRNLLDNAVRYAPAGTTVNLRFEAEQLSVENAGEPRTAEQVARLGERFHRDEGQQESGGGLGLSIVQRIAALHRLHVSFGACADGRGFRVVLTRA